MALTDSEIHKVQMTFQELMLHKCLVSQKSHILCQKLVPSSSDGGRRQVVSKEVATKHILILVDGSLTTLTIWQVVTPFLSTRSSIDLR